MENVSGSYYNGRIKGDGGDNGLEGGAGADVLDGRGGTDTAIYASAPSSMTIKLGEGTTDGTANVDSVVMTEWVKGMPMTYTLHNVPEDTLRNIENIVGTSYDDH